MTKEKFGCGIFIDIRKAFDTVNHDILLMKLEHYGIRDSALNWFESYLSKRKQVVSVNDEYSELRELSLSTTGICFGTFIVFNLH